MTGVIRLITVTRNQEEEAPGKDHRHCLPPPDLGSVSLGSPGVVQEEAKDSQGKHHPSWAPSTDVPALSLWDMHTGVHLPLEKVADVTGLWHSYGSCHPFVFKQNTIKGNMRKLAAVETI